jgi:hypothetical protein
VTAGGRGRERLLERERELAWRSASLSQRERSLQETEELSTSILMEMDRMIENEQLDASRCGLFAHTP